MSLTCLSEEEIKDVNQQVPELKIVDYPTDKIGLQHEQIIKTNKIVPGKIGNFLIYYDAITTPGTVGSPVFIKY